MRRALWFLTAPFVAGSLAWAAGMADDQPASKAPLKARTPSALAPKPKKGKFSFFSRSGKSGEDRAAWTEEPDAKTAKRLAEDTPPSAVRTPTPYVRNRAAAAKKPAKPEVKNYYHELFEDADLAAARDGASQPAARRERQADDHSTRAENPVQTAVNEERVESESSDNDGLATLPKKSKKPTVVSAQFEKSEDEAADQSIQQVQHKAPTTAVRKLPYLKSEVAKTAEDRAQKPVVEATQTAEAKPAVEAGPAEAPVASAETPVAPAEQRVAPGAPAVAPAKKIDRSGAVVKAHHSRTAKPAGTKLIPADADVTHAAAAAQAGTPVAAARAAAPPAAAAPAAAAPAAVTQALSAESQTPLINLWWETRGDVNVGQECKCALVAKNNGKVPAMDVVVEAYFPRAVRLLSADPMPAESHDHLAWNFDLLAPGEQKTIEINMIPARRGELATNATVRFTGIASAVMKVDDPQLRVAIKGPQEVSLGETATQLVTVSNPGSGVANDVVIHAVVPDGLENPRGKRLEISVGSLSPGESREVRLALVAISGGDQMLLVEARSGSNLMQNAESQIKVIAPQLDLAVTGPHLRYINRHAQYAITVTNSGAAANDNVRVVHQLPAGFEFVKTDRGGKFDRANRTITWFLGRVEAAQAIPIQLELAAKQIGAHQQQVQVAGDNGAFSEAKLETRVEGTVALVMEVVDLDDPVEIKAKTAYEIRIRNDGTKLAENLNLACSLPPGVELIDTEGPSEATRDKSLLIFKPLAELAPGKTITYQVRVAGTAPGNLKFRARLSSDSAPEPLIVEELTKFYAD